MKVHIEQDWARNLAKVYVIQRDIIAGTTRVMEVVGAGMFRWTDYKDGEHVQPTFVLPPDLLAALRDELNQLGPFSDSPVDWLRDALGTRDRLFSLVEKLTDDKP